MRGRTANVTRGEEAAGPELRTPVGSVLGCSLLPLRDVTDSSKSHQNRPEKTQGTKSGKGQGWNSLQSASDEPTNI